MEFAQQKLLKFAQMRGLIRPRDLAPLNIPRATLTRLVRRGALQRVARGLYSLPNYPVSEHVGLAEAAIKCPQGIICLLSALQFHQLTTQTPFEVWLAIPNKARAPKLTHPPLRIVRYSGASLEQGIEKHTIDGVIVPITTVAKTIADCFKFRNKIGLDIALEALREAWADKRTSMDELWHYAKVCRVSNVMRPYLESLV